MRVTMLAGVGSLSVLLGACDRVENLTPPAAQPVRLHVTGALKVEIRDLETLGGNFSQAAAINRSGQIVGYSSLSGGSCGGPTPQCRGFLWKDVATGMQDLGTLPGGNFSRAIDINDAGQIAGTSRISEGAECEQLGPITDGCRAVIWHNGTITSLGTLGGEFSAATDINEIGHVVGFSTTTSGATRAFYWDGTMMHRIRTLGGDRGLAWAVNDRGRVVGVSTTSGGEFHAFVWDYETKRLRDLGTLGGAVSQALAVNNRGDVVGYAYTADETPHAFFWDGWTMKDLETLGGEESIAHAINKWGDVVGSANTRPGGIGDPHPFIWNGSSGMRDLGTLGGVDGHAYAINTLMEVVGSAGVPESGTCTAVADCHAFFWDGVMHDLGHLGFPSSTAVDLNTRGQIVGSSQTPDRNTHAVLWKVRY